MNPELRRVISSPLCESKTRFIAPVTVSLRKVFGAHETEDIILCDAPGVGNTTGPEIDVANGVGVIEALKQFNSVKLLVLHICRSLGDKGQGIQKLAQLLIKMVNNIEYKLDSIFYAFTKYPPETNIYGLLLNIKKLKVDMDLTLQDGNTFVKVLSDMIVKTKGGVHKIDHIKGDRGVLIEQLRDLP
ncbi:unnamed protein product, partial [Rotaria sp. Silwood2]